MNDDPNVDRGGCGRLVIRIVITVLAVIAGGSITTMSLVRLTELVKAPGPVR